MKIASSMALYTQKPVLQASGSSRYSSRAYKPTHYEHYGSKRNVPNREYNDSLGELSAAQRNFFERCATVLGNDVRESILKYKQNVKNAVDEQLAHCGIMDTALDEDVVGAEAGRTSVQRNRIFTSDHRTERSPFRRDSWSRTSLRESRRRSSSSYTQHSGLSSDLRCVRDRTPSLTPVSDGLPHRRLSSGYASGRRLSGLSGSVSFRTRSDSVSSSCCSDSGLDSASCVSDADSASVRSMKSGLTCALVQKASYDKKVRQTKTAVSYCEGTLSVLVKCAANLVLVCHSERHTECVRLN